MQQLPRTCQRHPNSKTTQQSLPEQCHQILGKGRSNYAAHAVEFAYKEAGIQATPLREWCVAWPSDSKFRKDISESTLYVTLEPSDERQG